MKLRSKKTLVLLGALVVAAIAALGAYGYFTSTGSGSGSGSVGVASNWNVTTDAAVGGPLYPGAGSQSVAYHVKNVGGGNQQLDQVVVEVANADGSTWNSGACTAADFSVDGQAGGVSATDSYGVDLVPNAQANGTVTLQMLDTGVPQNDCQNVSVPLYLSAS